jgi:hypothetical protein
MQRDSNRNVMTMGWLVAQIAVIAVGFAWLRWEEKRGRLFLVPARLRYFELRYFVLHSRVSWCVIALIGYTVAKRCGPRIYARWYRAAAWLVVTGALVAGVYLIWAHELLLWSDLSDLGRPLPYPDWAITALERWYDLQYPLNRPYTIKLHGEYPRVADTFSRSIVLSILFGAMMTGLLFKGSTALGEHPTDEPRWCDS